MLAQPKRSSTNKFWELLARWCVCNDIPFHAIESLWLQEACYYLHPDGKLPSGQTIRNKVDILYERLQPRIREHLQGSEGLLWVTTDDWKSRNDLLFKGVTVHFIDSKWVLRNITLGFEPLEGHHTAEYLFTVFTSLIEFSRMGAVLLQATWHDLRQRGLR